MNITVVWLLFGCFRLFWLFLGLSVLAWPSIFFVEVEHAARDRVPMIAPIHGGTMINISTIPLYKHQFSFYLLHVCPAHHCHFTHWLGTRPLGCQRSKIWEIGPPGQQAFAPYWGPISQNLVFCQPSGRVPSGPVKWQWWRCGRG